LQTAIRTVSPGQGSDDQSGATVSSLDHVGVESLRPAVVRRRMNDTQIWVQLEFEGVEAKGQRVPGEFLLCLQIALIS